MNKSGFTLVELLIATLIAGLLGSLLISAVYQVNRAVPIIDTRSDVYEKAAIVNAQLERDLSGVIAPNEYYVRQKNAPKEAGCQE
jgi:prepilin-type N-terminal cleavage/methylation domain-containing protein